MALSDFTMDKKMCVIGIPILSQQMISLYPGVRQLITHIIIFVCKTKTLLMTPRLIRVTSSSNLPLCQRSSLVFSLWISAWIHLNSPQEAQYWLCSVSWGLSVAPERQIRWWKHLLREIFPRQHCVIYLALGKGCLWPKASSQQLHRVLGRFLAEAIRHREGIVRHGISCLSLTFWALSQESSAIYGQ